MLRILAAGAFLAAIVVGWLVFGSSSDSGESQSGGEVGNLREKSTGGEGHSQPAGQTGSGTMPAPLRMRSDTPSEGAAAVAPVAAQDSLAEAFAGEEVDKELAASRSAMIREVTESLMEDREGAAELKEIECRSRHCLLKIAGDDQKSVIALIDALQDERGFYGKAESLMMSRDGDVFHMYLRFAK
jgi:hypothetical protein